MTTKIICTDTDFNFGKLDNSFQIMSISPLSNEYPCQTVMLSSTLNKFRRYFRYFIVLDFLGKTINDGQNVCVFSPDVRLDVTDYEIQDNEVVLPLPIMVNMEEAFQVNHDLKDLKECEQIIDELYPDYTQTYDKVNGQYPVGAFIMSAKDFKSYHKFVYDILSEFFKRHNMFDDFDINNYLQTKEDYKENHQEDFIMVLIEKISTIFYMTYFKDYTVHHAEII